MTLAGRTLGLVSPEPGTEVELLRMIFFIWVPNSMFYSVTGSKILVETGCTDLQTGRIRAYLCRKDI